MHITTLRSFLIDSYRTRHWWAAQAAWSVQQFGHVTPVIRQAQAENEMFIGEWERRYKSETAK